MGQSLLNLDHDKRAYNLLQYPNNKELRLDSSKAPYTADLKAKVDIKPFGNQENHKAEENPIHRPEEIKIRTCKQVQSYCSFLSLK